MQRNELIATFDHSDMKILKNTASFRRYAVRNLSYGPADDVSACLRHAFDAVFGPRGVSCDSLSIKSRYEFNDNFELSLISASVMLVRAWRKEKHIKIITPIHGTKKEN